MIFLLWLISWITLFGVGHPYAASVDLCVGAGVYAVTLLLFGAAASAIARAAKKRL